MTTTRIDSTRRLARLALSAGLCLAAPFAGAAGYQVLHDFDGVHGGYPQAAMVIDGAGVLHGTAQVRVTKHDNGGFPKGGGTLFRIDTNGRHFQSEHYFGFPAGDGHNPLSPLVLDPAGRIVGTASEGGANDQGAIFALDPVAGYQLTFAFTGGTAGDWPVAGVTYGADGTLYGATFFGGDPVCDCGTIYKIDPATNALTTLHTFTGTDGTLPRASLALLGDTLYGTTVEGGPDDAGLPFSLKTDGSAFVTYAHDQGTMLYAGLTPDGQGNLYGAANEGIYRITAAGAFEWRASFGFKQGHNVIGSLLLGQDGMFYGGACNGGTNQENGTVFRYDPAANAITRLHLFTGDDGACPSASLVQDASGALYGTTAAGGQFGYGVIFRVTP